jgi:iron(III) transport system permease protein
MASISENRPLVSVKKEARAFDLDRLLMPFLILAVGAWLVVSVVLPLYEILSRSLQDKAGNFIGLDNYATYFSNRSLAASFENSLRVSLAATVITVTLAFIFAYALTRTKMPFKNVFRTLAILPVFAPSLLHGIAFIYLFGRQGLITRGFFGELPFLSFDIQLYQEPYGLILAQCFYLFPHALVILIVSLSLSDARLYEAATALGTPPWRAFLTITLPNARYGLISAAFVCFTLVITDFGIAKVIGGTEVMATEIYKQVIGQQNFVMGSTVSVLLLTPTVLGFIIDRFAQSRQASILSTRAVPWQPKANPLVDGLMLVYCTLIVSLIVGVIATAFMASVINVWPYERGFSWRHYDFSDTAARGFGPFYNSLQMAGLTAVIGTAVVFISAYLIEKGKGLKRFRALLYFLSTLPVALPGLVLGLAYIFFFNRPDNPLNVIYGTMTILVVSTIVHFYTVSFYTATAALKQIDREFEAVSDSLQVPFYQTFFRVTVPISLPAILEIAMYFFANAMTTVSAVIFLYSANLQLAAITIVNMDDAGDTASAAAMSMILFGTGVGVWVLYQALTWGIRLRTGRWRRK